MATTVLYERKGNIGYIILNRPNSLNAVNDDLVEDLIVALNKALSDLDTKVIVLKGEGRAFCAGADLKDQVHTERTIVQYRNHVLRMQDIGRIMLSSKKPLVAVVHGYAVGMGFELACNCDIRVVAEGTKMFSTETNVGATITTGVTKLLPAIIGLGRALEVFLTNARIDSTTAREWGLANVVVPLEKLEKAGTEMAEKLAANFPLSLSLVRHSTYRGLGTLVEEAFDEEAQAACTSYASKERITGMGSKIKN